MVNPVLFQSACILGSVHIAAIALYNPPRIFATNMIIGVLTSVWNHGMTHELAKWSDRGVMGVGMVIDLYYLAYIAKYPWNMSLAASIFSAAIGYLLAKAIIHRIAVNSHGKIQEKGNIPHLFAHVCLTIVHCFMCYHLSDECHHDASVNQSPWCSSMY